MKQGPNDNKRLKHCQAHLHWHMVNMHAKADNFAKCACNYGCYGDFARLFESLASNGDETLA